MSFGSGYIIQGRYEVMNLLGQGSFGEVYRCVNQESGVEVAIKVELADQPRARIIQEGRMYTSIQGNKGIPTIFWFGRYSIYNIMIMELLGLSIIELFHMCNKRFSMKTVLMVGDQVIGRCNICHDRKIVHRDIKPANLLIGMGKLKKLVYLVDFGLAIQYVEKGTRLHIPFKTNKGFTGTPRYASINAHKGYELSRRDDLESVGYAMMFLLGVSLPWEGIRAANKKQKFEKMFEKKLSTPIEEICASLPETFVYYLKYCRELNFTAEPDYSSLRFLLRRLLLDLNLEYDFEYDWSSFEDFASQKNNVAKYRFRQEGGRSYGHETRHKNKESG